MLQYFSFFFQAEAGIRDFHVTGVQTCALPIYPDALDELVVRDAEVVAVDGGRGEEGDPLVAPGVRRLAAILAGEDDGPRCAADREVAVDLDPAAVLHDSVAREGHRRILLGGEEVRRAEVGVALLVERED